VKPPEGVLLLLQSLYSGYFTIEGAYLISQLTGKRRADFDTAVRKI
jgi:hypothetical protein